jgi:hypothetical protein
MIYDDLQRLVGYGLSIIECYDEQGQLEYIINLDEMVFDDVDIVLSDEHAPIGIIKLYRYGQQKENGHSKLDGKDL